MRLYRVTGVGKKSTVLSGDQCEVEFPLGIFERLKVNWRNINSGLRGLVQFHLPFLELLYRLAQAFQILDLPFLDLVGAQVVGEEPAKAVINGLVRREG